MKKLVSISLVLTFEHVSFKACQYANVEQKKSKSLKYVFIKYAKIDL
jgi:hypothetical protein